MSKKKPGKPLPPIVQTAINEMKFSKEEIGKFYNLQKEKIL